jgi:hypothetical protein
MAYLVFPFDCREDARMSRRWLIRIPCLLPLVLIVGLWVTSHFGGIQICGGFWSRQFLFMSAEGLGCLDVERQGTSTSNSIDFIFIPQLTALNWYWKGTTPHFWGGRFWTYSDGFGSAFLFRFWLPTLPMVALNWFVWRKTRPKYNGKGFPIEPTAKAS